MDPFSLILLGLAVVFGLGFVAGYRTSDRVAVKRKQTARKVSRRIRGRH